MREKGNWISVRTKNFYLIGDASEKDIKAIGTRLEQFRESFRLLFPKIQFSSPRQTNVIVFKNSSNYRSFKPKRPDGKPDDGIVGYFQASEDMNYITLSAEKSSQDPFQTIFHEYVHYLMDTNFGRMNLPAWFNEGLAEYYETFRIEQDQIIFLGDYHVAHLELLRSSKMMPLKDLFTISNREVHAGGERSRSIFYAQSWALIHFLMHGRQDSNADSLGSFVSDIVKGGSLESGFNKAFGVSYSEMERELKKYLDQRSFKGAVIKLGNKLNFEDSMTSTPLPEAQANAYLGDLLYRLGDSQAAEKYLARALELDSGSVLAHTSLGLMRMRERRFDEARELLETAIATDNRNHLAHYSYAYALSRESMDEFGYVRSFPEENFAKIRESLQRSIELNPEFSQSYKMLAWVNMVNGVYIDEALGLLRRGLQMEPGNEEIIILMSKILLRQGKFADARTLAERLMKNSSDERTSREAEEIVASVKQLEESNRQLAGIELMNGGLISIRPDIRLVRREEVSAEEVKRIDRERVLRNLNHRVGVPKYGEVKATGRIEHITCSGGLVRYEIKGDQGDFALQSRDFQSISLDVLLEGTNEREIGCDVSYKEDLVVLFYRPETDERSKTKGVLSTIIFVPEFFRFMTAEELAAPTTYVIGGPPTDLAANERKIEEELAKLRRSRQAAYEREQSKLILQQINEGLRKPAEGEIRKLGQIDRIECSGKNMTAIAWVEAQEISLRVPVSGAVTLTSFVSNAGKVELGCNSRFPGLWAVVTYFPDAKPKGKIVGELRAVEFVPQSFDVIR
ncbi:tetratricopeptide repeat protein [Leptolyngbya sp. 7M]|uniref:tetratricopeptide repeat protein n=1 Tax=Leptolyngbya sp. 7M TaxID=2812896 RepID=UPI001B8B10E6|nr:tetratricopeptide repeat protein [Leptolyngbya sp. 7M]QYO65415.1 tetratricopeptide repeat protein [Leptolyngbya sp. 7M]